MLSECDITVKCGITGDFQEILLQVVRENISSPSPLPFWAVWQQVPYLVLTLNTLMPTALNQAKIIQPKSNSPALIHFALVFAIKIQVPSGKLNLT